MYNSFCGYFKSISMFVDDDKTESGFSCYDVQMLHYDRLYPLLYHLSPILRIARYFYDVSLTFTFRHILVSKERFPSSESRNDINKKLNSNYVVYWSKREIPFLKRLRSSLYMQLWRCKFCSQTVIHG